MALRTKRQYDVLLLGTVNAEAKPQTGKQIKALLQGPRYGSSLEDSITTVRKRSKLFEERVNTLSLQMTARTDVNTQRTEKTIQVVNFHTEQICSTTRMTATHIDELVTTADEIKVSQQYSQQHLGNKLDNIHQGMEAQSRENKETQNKMQDLLKESMRQSECTSFILTGISLIPHANQQQGRPSSRKHRVSERKHRERATLWLCSSRKLSYTPNIAVCF